MTTNVDVNLNVHEIGVILSALQLLQHRDENLIAREYGSTTALYDKLNAIWETLDRSEVGIRNDMCPSY